MKNNNSIPCISQPDCSESMESLPYTLPEDGFDKVNTLNYAGRKQLLKANFAHAMQYFLGAKQLALKLSYQKGLADSLAYMGRTHEFGGDYVHSLDCQIKALKIRDEIGDREGMSYSLHFIGDIYHSQGNLADNYYAMMEYNDKALEHFFKSLKIAEDVGDKQSIADSYNCIGNSYRDQNRYHEAAEYYMRALELRKKTGDKEGFAITYNNIGILYLNQGEFDKAIENFFKSKEIAEQIGNKRALVKVLGAIGNCYLQEKKYSKACEYSTKSLVLGKEINLLEFTTNANHYLSKIYETPDFAGHNAGIALKYYKDYIIGRDSINSKKLEQVEMQLEYDKREALAKMAQDKKDAITDTIKQKNKDILDSLTYAKRLQEAILSPKSLIEKYFPESFVLYKPKDIVAGDFYWIAPAQPRKETETINLETPCEGLISSNEVYLAAADCTGHGVPAAFVSIICNEALNRTIKEYQVSETGKILDKVSEIVMETFEKSENNVQDGMDISLLSINYMPLANTFEAQWSGAYNSLLHIHNGVIIEIPADRQPIGKSDRPIPFKSHNLKLFKGDILYLFTDGYADQFGGLKGKKFTIKQMRDKLLTFSHLNMRDQYTKLEETFNTWKGSLEQVDDVLIIGIRI